MVRRKTRRGSPLHLTPSFELFKKSKRLVLDNRYVFLPLYLVPFLFLAHSWLWNIGATHGREHWYLDFQNRGGSWTGPTLPLYTWGYFLGFFSVIALMWMVVSVVVQIMVQAAQLDVAHGNKPDFSHLWTVTKEVGWRMVGLYLLIGLYILVGFILLIIPGLIMLRRYYLAPYVLLDERGSIKEAMEKSAALSKPHSGYVWGVIGVMFLINMLSLIPFIGNLAAFTLGFLYCVAPALRYQELKRVSHES